MKQQLTRIGTSFGRWPIALGVVVILAAAILLPGLGGPGFWEPQERQLADRIAPRDELAKKKSEDEAKAKAAKAQTRAAAEAKAKTDGKPLVVPVEETCPRQAPDDAYARSLHTRAPAFGRDTAGDSDAGRRLPFAVFGFLTVLAVAGIAMRTISSRAGILAGIVVLSFPLLILQSRMLTSEIGTACGASLIVYGLVAIGRAPRVLGVVEAIVGLGAIAAGVVLGFMGGGILLGLIVPIGAYAAAGALGVPALATLARAIGRAILLVASKLRPRVAIGRTKPEAEAGDVIEAVKALVATLAVIALIGVLAYQIYEIRRPYPGMMPPGRSILGRVVAATGCWSNALGGIWKPEDDLRSIYDSTFEQIAYGTFPWGILAPIAMASLLRSNQPQHRRLGALTLAWAGAAWVAGEVFQRKVGFSIWAGFPAMAIAIGAWLDALLTERRTDSGAGSAANESSSIGPTLLVGLFVLLAVLDLGKDLQSFTEKLTSLTLGGDAIPYPTQSRLAWLPTRLWILILGLLVALSFAISMIVWRPRTQSDSAWMRTLATLAAAVAIGATVITAAFWSFGWHPTLAINLSSKTMFDTWHDLRGASDQLVVMGDLGDAPYDYAGPDHTKTIDGKTVASSFEKLDSRDKIVAALGRPNRVFAIAPQADLCTLHREIGGKPYFVLDDRNTRSVLLSNKIDGATDQNPLATAIVHTEPKQIPQRPKGPVIWDKKIQLLGWDIPKVLNRNSKVEIKLYYKILAPVAGAWTSLMHFDGANGRAFNGDHKPINDRCPTSTWQPGDFIIDSYAVNASASAFSRGNLEVWIGFFTGSNPNWKNMPVAGPKDMLDGVDRVKIMTVTLD